MGIKNLTISLLICISILDCGISTTISGDKDIYQIQKITILKNKVEITICEINTQNKFCSSSNDLIIVYSKESDYLHYQVGDLIQLKLLKIKSVKENQND